MKQVTFEEVAETRATSVLAIHPHATLLMRLSKADIAEFIVDPTENLPAETFTMLRDAIVFYNNLAYLPYLHRKVRVTFNTPLGPAGIVGTMTGLTDLWVSLDHIPRKRSTVVSVELLEAGCDS